MKSVIVPYLPYKVKSFLKSIYPKKLTDLVSSTSYDDRVAEEKRHYLKMYQDRAEDEPLFEHAPASWGYLERATERLIRAKTGYSQWEYIINYANQLEAPMMLSLGSGPCGIEMSLAEKFTTAYQYHCIDLNEHVLEIGKKQILKKNLNITVEAMDLNYIQLETEKYEIITAFSALHHLENLEEIYSAINNALKPNGVFVTVDVITHNGLMMWPETHEQVKKLWSIWPDKFKFNHTLYATPRFTPEYENIDFGEESFEAIRAQDLLPLLPEYFDPIVYVPYYAISRRFLDTQYGKNYNLNDPFDYSMVEFIWNLDCYYIRERILPPETMFAVMRKKNMGDPKVVTEVATRMRQDSRARMDKWITPSDLSTMSYWLKTAKEELLANSQFEILEDGLPISWTIYGAPIIDSTGAKSNLGKTAIRGDKNSGLFQAVPVKSNQEYLLKHSTRADKKIQMSRLQVNWHDTQDEFIKTNIEVIEAKTTWQENEMIISAPPKAAKAIVYVSVHEGSEIWFDYISFVEVEKESLTVHGSLANIEEPK